MPQQVETQNPTGHKPKVKPKKPPKVPAVDDLAVAVASGTTHPHRKSDVLPAEVQAQVEDKPVHQVKKERRAAKHYAAHHQAPHEVASPGTVAQEIDRFKHPEPKSYDIFVDKAGHPEHFSDYARPYVHVLNALTGHDPNASEGQNLLNVGENVASLLPAAGVFKAAKAGQEVIRGEQALNTASNAKKAEELIAAAAKARKAERAAARAKEASKAAKVRVTVKTAATQTAKRARPAEVQAAAKRKAARSADRAVASVTNPLVPAVAATPTDAGKRARAAVEGTAKAIVHHPLDTAQTTAGAIYGAPAAVVGDLISVATGNPGKVLEEYKKYGKTVAKLASGDPAKVERVTANKVGLIPAATGLGLGHRAIKAGRRAIGKEEAVVKVRPRGERQRARDLKKAAKGDEAAAKRIEQNKYEVSPRTAKRQRREEAVRQDIAQNKLAGTLAAEMKRGGKRKLGPAKRLEAEMNDAAKRHVSGKISEADVIRIVAAHGYKGPDAVAALKTMRDNLKEPTRPLKATARDTRKVLDALISRPDAITHVQGLIDRFEEIQTQHSIRRHSTFTGEHQTTPNPLDERARLLPVARELGLPLGGELIPRGLEGITKHKPTPGVDAEKAIRAEARAAKKTGIPSEVARAKQLRAVVGRYRRANKIERQAHKDLAAGVITEDEFNAIRTEAEQLRETHRADQASRDVEAAQVINKALEDLGRRQPVHVPQTDASTSIRTTSNAVKDKARKEKMLTGALESQGRVDESGLTLIHQLHKSRANEFAAEREARFVDTLARRIFPMNERIGTQVEFQRALESGEVPIGLQWEPLQSFSAGVHSTEALRREREAAKLRVKATSPKGDRALGIAVPKHNLAEFHAQSEAMARGWQAARKVMHAQSIFMLGTSPQFAEFQMVATPLQILMRHSNPVRHVQAFRHRLEAFRHYTPEEKAGVRAMAGAVSVDMLSLRDRAHELDPTTVTIQRAGLGKLLHDTPAGNLMLGIARTVKKSVRKGGPLIQGVSKYEQGWRLHNYYLEMDRASGLTLGGKQSLSSHVRDFMEGVAGTAVEQERFLKKLDGMKPHEIDRYLQSPEGYADQARLLERIRDNLGNYGAFTATERNMASLIPFYGFFRASLHTMAAFPSHNPIKAAILGNLGAQNEDQLKRLFGGDPGFFSQLGQTVVYGPDGKRHLLDISRALPGGNAALSTIGDVANEGLNITNAAGIVQPGIGIVLGALARQGSTGQPLPKDETQLDALLKGVSNLNPWTRKYLSSHIGPEPSKFAQLYKAIQNADPTTGPFSNASPLLPDLTDNPRVMQDSVRLSKLLKTAFAIEDYPAPSQIPVRGPEHKAYIKAKKAADAAWKEVDAMMVAYGVQTKVQQKREAKKASTRTSVNQYGHAPPPKVKPGGGNSIFGNNDAPVFSNKGSGQSIFGHSNTPVFK